MEGYSLQSPSVATVPSSLFLSGLPKKAFIHGRVLKFPDSKGYPNAGKLKFLNIRAQASGTTKVGAEAVQPISKKEDLKDDNVVFVAGATGRVGSRTVRELLKLGFQVRAGVRSAQKAESLVQSVKQMKLDVENASEGTQRKKIELWKPHFLLTSVEKLELVECDLEKRDRILPALGNASVVICCIGASEKEVFDITGPYRIDYLATKNLIDAATVAKVKHFVLLTSLGTNKFGFPAAILNLFWGVLIWKRKAEEALLASGLPYTIVRPGGMERPTDAYKETHNITLSQEDTLFGGQVSNLQVAELMAFIAKNRSLSYCKVVEVIAETTAPLTPMEKLLAKIPSQRADIYSQKESGAAAGPDSSPPETVKSEKPSPPIEKGPSDASAKVISTQPLSPYIAYEDLKPPTSPTPTPSTTPGATKPSSVDTKPAVLESSPSPPPSAITTEEKPTGTELGKPRPLSPYTCYEDLKPPSSPSPSLGSSKGTPYPASTPAEVESPSGGGNDVAKTVATGVVEKFSSESSTSSYSPYAVYEGLKPLTTPSPNAPTVRLPTSDMDGASDTAALSVNNVPQLPTADKGMDKQHHTGPKPRPLSPFTMYDDLKPPTSPIPSPRRS